MWSNFHTHTNYCDGKGTFNDCLRVSGIKSIGFSSHAPLPFGTPWAMRADQLENYLNEIERLRVEEKSIELYAGLEVDYIPGLIAPTNFNNLDYTIGSIHFVDAFPDSRPWEIDGTHSLFLEGLQTLFNNKPREAWSRYFELTREMIRQAPPTILGHLDKMKIQNIGLFDEQDPWYREEIKQTLDSLKGTGIIVEVNTRGLYQKKSTTTYPSPWILAQIKAAGIPITLSSDAHYPEQLFNEFSETARLLKSIGFKQVSILLQGTWQRVDFDEYGLLLD
ncbi:MAG TPA: histidinol-phosphatase [Cyclobacteriaceae bacterium]|nr:histidinol-phosphatase [Cyclobacteriaceae bacterium]